MKQLFLICAFVFCAPLAFAASHVETGHIPDLPPDATSEDYQHFLKSYSAADASFDFTFDAADGLDEIVAAGARNLQWLVKINGSRPDGRHLSFTDANHRVGYPVNNPRVYNPTLIQTQYQNFLNRAPQAFRDAVTGDKDLPSATPAGLSDEDYISLGRDLDRIYQISTRWRMMTPYLDELTQVSANDVRGYWFLSHDASHEDKLSHYSALADADKAQVNAWLVQMCRNATEGTAETCGGELAQSVTAENGSALKFYNTYLQAAKDHYDSYFKIPDGAARSNLTWTKDNPNLAIIPFLDPMTDVLRKFMLNVEDEWHWGDWHLHLNFVSQGDVPHLEFKAGATPHVNGVGGDIITMDQNTPLTDWEVNWTIRHEFGHVLGFLDCYIEFYDQPNKQMIAYQLDLTNLMCSRKGNLKETHYDELKRVYFK